MIQVQKVSLSLGGSVILRELTWTARAGQRIGLVGPNGAGKTTLLRLIAGDVSPDEGTIAVSGNTSIGFLRQDVQEAAYERSVLDEAMTAFDEVLAMEAEQRDILRKLAQEEDHETPEYQRLLEAQARVHEDLDRLEAHLVRPRTEAVLTGLGFEPDGLHRPMETFSGGWRMRVELAKILLRQPDFLLLDEPTNHLDIDSIDWLESYLKGYPGTVVIVSHDRYFLDRMVTSIAELSRGSITEYPGHYGAYVEERDKRRTLQLAAYTNQQKQIADTERFIERFRYKASKATQVQSRIKMLEKMARIGAPPSDEASITFRFPEPPRSGRTVLELSRFNKSYQGPDGAIPVFSDTGPVQIERGDKVAIIGKNGAGKSTLARMLFGTEPFDGDRTVGYHVEPAFFAQHQADSLLPVRSVLESVLEIASGRSETEVRGLLGAFLFSGDDVFKPVGVLSGGEKSRVALARTLLQPTNFLILDEPTNHLDMQSMNVLIEALRQYSGTFVVVSHDRHFLDRVINKVWRLGGGKIASFFGNYSDYLWQVHHGSARMAETRSSNRAASEPGPVRDDARSGGPKSREQKRREAEERNRRYKELREASGGSVESLTPVQLRGEYERVEASILDREQLQRELESELGSPALYSNVDRVREATTAYDSIRAELAHLYDRWEQLAARLID